MALIMLIIRRFLLCTLLLLLYPHSPAFAIETRFSGAIEIFGASYTRHKQGSEDIFGEFHLKPKLTLIPNDQLLALVSGLLSRL